MTRCRSNLSSSCLSAPMKKEPSTKRSSPDVSLRRCGAPLHDVVDAVRVDVLKAEAVVEMPRGIEVLDIDRHHFPVARRFIEDFLQQLPAESLSTKLRHQSDVDDLDFFFAPNQLETSDR